MGDAKGHCGAIPGRLQKHVAMATGIEDQETHETVVWGDSLHSPTEYFTLSWVVVVHRVWMNVSFRSL